MTDKKIQNRHRLRQHRVFNYKKINFKLLGLSLFTGAGFCNVNVAPNKLLSISNNYVSSSVHAVHTVKKFNLESLAVESTRYINNLELFVRLEKDRQYLIASVNNNSSNSLPASGKEDKKYILNLTALEKIDNSAKNYRYKIIRTVLLYFFWLLFVPFGIFYPFFLFYKKLLNKDDETGEVVELDYIPELKPYASFNPESSEEKEPINDVRAVVSQLQIAFAVKDNSLRRKLTELCSSVDSRTDRGVIELMRKTISFLIELDEWTHVSCSSVSFPINRTKTEFEAICIREQNKFVSENLSAVDKEERAVNPTLKAIDDSSTVYMIVTLALCTSHSQPLFEEIYTKNQLHEELSKLGKMKRDKLIRFDLLWNPRSENQYLSNNELLLNYIDMIRLF